MSLAFSGKPTHDVLCVGHASYDLVFSVPRHPLADEKIFADDFLACGGGPAANAAVIVARLGYQSAFAGYLGDDLCGESHFLELVREGVDTRCLVRGTEPTPLSCVLVKHDGGRALVNYKGSTRYLTEDCIDFSEINPKVVLFDGHEPLVSIPLAARARDKGIPLVLDAGSLHEGTKALMDKVDYLVASEKFAIQWLEDFRKCLPPPPWPNAFDTAAHTGRDCRYPEHREVNVGAGSDPAPTPWQLGSGNPCRNNGQNGDVENALAHLAGLASIVVITLGERGLIWRKEGISGTFPAFPIKPVDTTGAGDAFHGAFAAGIAAGLPWDELLGYASAAGALCCQRFGARTGLALADEIRDFLAVNPLSAIKSDAN